MKMKKTEFTIIQISGMLAKILKQLHKIGLKI